MVRNLYSLYEGGKCIKENMRAKEVKSFTGLLQTAKLRKYYNDGFLLCGKYRLEVVGTAAKEPSNKLTDAERETAKAMLVFGKENYAELCRMNRRYGGR